MEKQEIEMKYMMHEPIAFQRKYIDATSKADCGIKKEDRK